MPARLVLNNRVPEIPGKIKKASKVPMPENEMVLF
jgi:hypothetical protein